MGASSSLSSVKPFLMALSASSDDRGGEGTIAEGDAAQAASAAYVTLFRASQSEDTAFRAAWACKHWHLKAALLFPGNKDQLA